MLVGVSIAWIVSRGRDRLRRVRVIWLLSEHWLLLVLRLILLVLLCLILLILRLSIDGLRLHLILLLLCLILLLLCLILLLLLLLLLVLGLRIRVLRLELLLLTARRMTLYELVLMDWLHGWWGVRRVHSNSSALAILLGLSSATDDKEGGDQNQKCSNTTSNADIQAGLAAFVALVAAVAVSCRGRPDPRGVGWIIRRVACVIAYKFKTLQRQTQTVQSGRGWFDHAQMLVRTCNNWFVCWCKLKL